MSLSNAILGPQEDQGKDISAQVQQCIRLVQVEATVTESIQAYEWQLVFAKMQAG